jgi:hypothetical protein
MIFPTFVYKAGGGPGRYKKKKYQYFAVQDETQRQEMLAKGWLATRDEALGLVQKKVEPIKVDEPNAAPTRAELEQKARELGLKFDGRTSDKKLLKLIEGN